MGLGAKSHDWTRTPGNLSICLPCGQYAHERPTVDCPAYRPDYDPEVLRKRIAVLEAAFREIAGGEISGHGEIVVRSDSMSLAHEALENN
jgi:hypothetical protein